MNLHVMTFVKQVILAYLILYKVSAIFSCLQSLFWARFGSIPLFTNAGLTDSIHFIRGLHLGGFLSCKSLMKWVRFPLRSPNLIPGRNAIHIPGLCRTTVPSKSYAPCEITPFVSYPIPPAVSVHYLKTALEYFPHKTIYIFSDSKKYYKKSPS